jgi:glycosyltransferase involved in cell wall biosynthesis
MISVIIPTFNRSEFVIDALNSVANQSWSAIEIIVVDDGSTDDTVALVEQWVRSRPAVTVWLLRQPNRGVSAARNAGAAVARGEFLYFLDSDDLIHPQALETLAAPLLQGAAPYSLGHIHNVDLLGNPIGDLSEGISKQSDKHFASHWMTHASLYRRSTFTAVGPFDEGLLRGEDTEHHWRVVAIAGPGVLVNKYIGQRRIHNRGHLYIGRTATEGARDDLAAVRHFLEWADRGPLNPRGCQAPAIRLIVTAIRAGARRDWISHGEALSLIRRFGGRPTRASSIALRILNWRSPVIHSALAFLGEGAKWARPHRYSLQRKAKKIQTL